MHTINNRLYCMTEGEWKSRAKYGKELGYPGVIYAAVMKYPNRRNIRGERDLFQPVIIYHCGAVKVGTLKC